MIVLGPRGRRWKGTVGSYAVDLAFRIGPPGQVTDPLAQPVFIDISPLGPALLAFSQGDMLIEVVRLKSSRRPSATMGNGSRSSSLGLPFQSMSAISWYEDQAL